MTSDKIITFMRIADYNKEFLPSNKRDLTGTELEKAIIENIYKDLFFIWHPFEIVPNDYISQY